MLPLFVSRKKYEKLKNEIISREEEIFDLKNRLKYCRTELDKQIAVNESLERFSDSFKKFYRDVRDIPLFVKSEGNSVSISCVTFIDERELSYGDVVNHLKSQMIYDISKKLESAGLVKFDLIDDPAVGRVAYKATISVVKEV